MKKRIVIITGANSGIGKAAAIKFAKEGHQVIMACRNLEKSKQAHLEVEEVSKRNDIELMELDISSFSSIRSFCSQFKNKYERLDILIHNAAYFNHGEKNYQLSDDNIELTFATNAFGPFLMTNLLVGHLAKSEDPRVLHACSTNIRHFFDPKRKIEFHNLRGELKDSQPYSVYKNYGNSKMALLMLTFKLAEQYPHMKINAIQIPAIKMSKDTLKKVSPMFRAVGTIQNFFSDSQESMADTYYYICTSEQFKNVTGKLVNDNREVVKSSHYQDTFAEQIKQFFDKKVYPKYADNREITDKVWEVAVRFTEK